jgi:hypothetical protein
MAVAAHEHPFAVPRFQHHVKFHFVARAKRTRRERVGKFRPVTVRGRHTSAKGSGFLKSKALCPDNSTLRRLRDLGFGDA